MTTNDSFGSGYPVAVTLVTPPSDVPQVVGPSAADPAGGFEWQGDDFLYVAPDNWDFSDSFTYKLSTPEGESTATVSLTWVNSPPVAEPDGPYGALADAPLVVPDADGVLVNDVDYDLEAFPGSGLTLTAELVTNGAYGGVSLNPGGGFTYTPADPNWYGTDSFEYRAFDGQLHSGIQTVSVNVNDLHVFQDVWDITEFEGEAWIGQKVSLSVDFAGPGFPLGYQLSNPQWTIASNAIKGYTTDTTSGTVSKLEPQDLQNLPLNLYWTNPSVKNVQIGVTVTVQQKIWSQPQVFSVTANGKVDVLAPLVSLTELTMSDVTLQDPWNVPEGEALSEYNGGVGFELGDWSVEPYVPGIKAEYAVNEVLPGTSEVLWFQVMRTTNQRIYYPQSGYITKSGANVLDGNIPYEFDPFEDSPAVVIHPDDLHLVDSIFRQDDFTAFLSFKYSSADSIRVPILGIDWSWQGYAWNDDGIWRLDPQLTFTAGPTVVNYPDLPEWEGNYNTLVEGWE